MKKPTLLVKSPLVLVGKYTELPDAYKSVNEALKHAGLKNRLSVTIKYVDSQDVESKGTELLDGLDAILVPGGFGDRGIEGKILAAQYARENKVPYLGICLGMQVALIEYARNVAGMEGAHSTEFSKDTKFPVVGLITEWVDQEGNVEERTEKIDWVEQCALVHSYVTLRKARKLMNYTATLKFTNAIVIVTK